jgi:hypothetical protein
MAHSGGNGMAQGRRWRRDGSVTMRGDTRRQIWAGECVNGEETGRAVASDEHVNGQSRARGRGAEERGLPARERADAREKG